MAGPLAAVPVIVALGKTLLRVAPEALPNLLKAGAKLIKKPTIQQKKESIIPSQLGKEVKKPKRYRNYQGREGIRPKLDPKKDIKMYDDFANYSHGGSTKKGKQRGMGKALRGGGAVTRSK
tara:strand:- start:1394 stop:1756 length:363 start_codon:yes stop_codon:yes gene_type:complete